MYVAMRDVYLKYAGTSDCWETLDRLKVNAVEVRLDDDMRFLDMVGHDGLAYSGADDEGRTRLVADAKAHGVYICALCMDNMLSRRDCDGNELSERDRAHQVRRMIDAVRIAEAMGVGVVRVNPARKHAGVTPHQQRLSAVEMIREALDQTSDAAVKIGVENHGMECNAPEDLDEILRGVGSDRLGLTVDVANFYWYGHPLAAVYELVEQFAGHVCHTHIKNAAYPPDKRSVSREIGWEYGTYSCPIPDGDIDYARVVSILARAGYQGDLSIEDESVRDMTSGRFEALKRDADYLKAIAGDIAKKVRT